MITGMRLLILFRWMVTARSAWAPARQASSIPRFLDDSDSRSRPVRPGCRTRAEIGIGDCGATIDVAEKFSDGKCCRSNGVMPHSIYVRFSEIRSATPPPANVLHPPHLSHGRRSLPSIVYRPCRRITASP